MAINPTWRTADRGLMTRVSRRFACRQDGGDQGFSMVEMIVALIVISIVATASVGFFVSNIRGLNNQRQHQEAVNLANQQLETIEAISVAPSQDVTTGVNNLVRGRTKSEVQTVLFGSAAATALNISGQDDTTNSGNWDSTATTTGNETVPATTPQTVNSVLYTSYNFIDVCWYSVTDAACGPTKTPADGSTTTQEYRVTVYETWTSPGACSSACSYSTSTLIDPTADPVFNSNISLPSGSFATGTFNTDNVYTGVKSCTTSAGTDYGTKEVVTGTNLNANIRVWIGSGGGSISEIAQPSATEVDFCLQTGDDPGTYTISVINTDGGHFQRSITEVPNIVSGTGWDPSTKNLTLTGGGLETGASISVSGGASYSSYSVTDGGGTTTPSVGGYDSITIGGFSGLTSGTSTITVTNPDGSTTSYKITPPTAGTLSKTKIYTGLTATVNITGATGFEASPNTLGVAVAATSPSTTASIAYTSASAATLTLTPTASGTLTLYVYNDDGGYTTETLTVVDISKPTITSISPTTVVAGKSTTFTVVGTNYQSGLTVSIAENGTALTPTSATLTGTTQLTFLATPLSGVTGAETFTVTITNPDTGTITGSRVITVDAPPTVSAIAPTTALVSKTTTFTVTGTGFQSGATYTLSEAGTSIGSGTVGYTSSTSVTVVGTTLSSTGSKSFSVTVTNPDTGSGTGTQTITVNANPAITSISPASVLPSAATTFTLTGTGFQSGATYTISEAGTSIGSGTVGYTSSTSVTVAGTTLSGTGSKSFSVTLTNPDGGTTTATATITVDALPTITSYAIPAAGVAPGVSATWTVTGTGFQSGATYTVTENGTTVGSGTVGYTSSTSVTVAVSPTTSTGSQPFIVTITNPDTGAASRTQTVSVDALPVLGSITSSSTTHNSTTTVTLGTSGTSGLVSGATVTVSWTRTGGPNSTPTPGTVTLTGSTKATFSVATPTSAKSGYTLKVTWTNPDGGSTSISLTGITTT
ncbi:MAG TPA: prepilin-type N-terminal cleavage/methylation domain-containing protein [Mycobacteriales bacterium]|nr:prepilin-type N-terminal cleavage/methylation domain-containing protein [Mycobacteriales bacterium]